MKFRIELEQEDILHILRWLESSGQTMLAVKVRDQYVAQRQAVDEALEQAAEKKPAEGFDEFFRGLKP